MKHLMRNDELVDVKEDARYVVIDPSPVAGHIRLFDQLTTQEVFTKFDVISKGIANGDWLHERPGRRATVASPQIHNDPRLDSATQQALGIVREIKRLSAKARISVREAIRRVRATRNTGRLSCKFPSDATLYRLLSRERNDMPLYIGERNKGNRQPRRSHEVRQLIVSMAKNHFIQVGSRWTLRDLVEQVNTVALVEDYIGSDDRISRTYVRNLVAEECGPDLEIDRMDPRTARAFKSIAKTPIVTSYVLERVEQDTVHLPWRVVTPDGVSYSIHLVHAIDCYTGMVVGWQLVVGSPSVTNSLQCIESILFSKEDRFRALGIKTEKDCYGTPMLIVLDNGPENKGDRISKLAHILVDVMHCKAHTPQEKPFIERLNRALKESLQTLPGCTRFDDQDGARDPEKLNDLPMSLAELERWVVRFYYEDWANRELRRLQMSVFKDPQSRGTTPWTRWHHAVHVAGQSVPLPPSRQEWLKTMYLYERRTLSRKTGITYRSFTFKGKNLPSLVENVGETMVQVLVDPDDFRRVMVVGPDEQLIELVNSDTDETTPAHSFDAAAKLLRDSKEDNTLGEEERRKFRIAVFKASTVVPPRPSKSASKPETTKQTTAQSKRSRAVERAVRTPMQAHGGDVAPSTYAVNFDDVEPMQVRDRRSGDVA